MSQVHWQRGLIVSSVLVAISAVVFYVLTLLGENLNVYLSASTFHEKDWPRSYEMKVGGLVKEGSLEWLDERSLKGRFVITDGQSDVVVYFQGLLPSLFKEGKGIIARGHSENHELHADLLLAKHDESYRPPAGAG